MKCPKCGKKMTPLAPGLHHCLPCRFAVDDERENPRRGRRCDKCAKLRTSFPVTVINFDFFLCNKCCERVLNYLKLKPRVRK